MRSPWDTKIEAETAEEVEQIQTPAGMRKWLWQAERNDPLVRNVFRLAMERGYSSEEMYLYLAYHALVARDKAMAMYREYVENNIKPMVIHRDGVNSGKE